MQTEIYELQTLTQNIGHSVLITADSLTLLGTLEDISKLTDETYVLTITNDSETRPIHTDISLKDEDLISFDVTLSVDTPEPAIPTDNPIYLLRSSNPKAFPNTLYSYSEKLDRWLPWNSSRSCVPLRAEDILDYDIIDLKTLPLGDND